jgi:hypothetical protein
MNKYFFLILWVNICTISYCQNPFSSETTIKYDLLTAKCDKPIPFDQAFTLVVEKILLPEIKQIQVYEAKVRNGKRELVKDDGTGSVKDFRLNFIYKDDVLRMFFPALIPNVDFDINIVCELGKENKSALNKINLMLYLKKDSLANEAFKEFGKTLTDKFTNRTYLADTVTKYKQFFKNSLRRHYDSLRNKLDVNATLTTKDLQILDTLSANLRYNLNSGIFLSEVLQQSKLKEIQFGLINIYKIFTAKKEVDTLDVFSRYENLQSNLKFFDTLQQRMDRVISRGPSNQLIFGKSENITQVWTNINQVRKNLISNYKIVSAIHDSINTSINNRKEINQGFYLAGNTLSSDLKTEGSSLLFLDAGLSNIFVRGVNNEKVYIPKLYWGATIYFRSIDKNTRNNKFPRMCSLKKSDTTDYRIMTKRSVWQHLGLNIGLTVGSMTNKDFDNFYNNTSLLVGPAVRFKRAFKLSGGVAFVRRSSVNPVISDKKPIMGSYISLSVDIDFIQSLKDVTSILFK